MHFFSWEQNFPFLCLCFRGVNLFFFSFFPFPFNFFIFFLIIYFGSLFQWSDFAFLGWSSSLTFLFLYYFFAFPFTVFSFFFVSSYFLFYFYLFSFPFTIFLFLCVVISLFYSSNRELECSKLYRHIVLFSW